MKISISANLLKLAKLFKKKNAKLFLVGGYVRNACIGIPSFDVDICSSLKLEDVEKLLINSDYVLKIKNKDLGTADIICGNNNWEYTVLRTETYAVGGAHSPEKVEFIKSVDLDATRRDFTINSIYLDIAKGEIVDPFDALKDIDKKLVKAVKDPNEVFSHDGLRILRMIRFASELNFSIDNKTFAGALNNKDNLSDISGERKRKELIELLACSNKYVGYTKKKAYLIGLQRYNKLSIWKYFNLPIEKVRYRLVKKADIENKLLALVVDITNEVNPRDRFAFLTNFLGVDGLNFSNDEVSRMTNIICGYFDAIEKLNNKDYFFKYFNNFPTIAMLLKKQSVKLYKKYNFFYKYLVNNKIAIQVKDLDIKGSDIKRNYPDIPQRRYSYILNELLSKVFDGAIINKKDKLLEEVKNYDY